MPPQINPTKSQKGNLRINKAIPPTSIYATKKANYIDGGKATKTKA